MFKVYPFCGWNVTDQEGMLSEVIAVNMPTVSKFWSAVTGSLTRTIVNLDSTRCKNLEHGGNKVLSERH